MSEQALRRARTTDPATSKRAAASADRFAKGHSVRILSALESIGSGTAAEIGKAASLTVEQVDRRACELIRAGRVRVLVDDLGREVVRAGFRVLGLAA